MNSALASLRGDAPIVRLHINVLWQPEPHPEAAVDEAAAAWQEAAAGGEAHAAAAGAAGAAAGGARKEKESLLSKFGWCRSKQQFEGTVDSWSRHGERLVSVQLEVAGGVDLSLIASHRKSRRVPSHEAIDLIAGGCAVLELLGQLRRAGRASRLPDQHRSAFTPGCHPRRTPALCSTTACRQVQGAADPAPLRVGPAAGKLHP
jgi:hypothetical protein